MEDPMKFSCLHLERNKTRFVLLLVGLALLGITPVASGISEPRPDAPAQLDAIATSVQQVVLTWSAPTANTGITRYSIHRNGEWLATVGSHSPDFIDTNVRASSTYSYTVRAIGADDESSAASNVATVQTPALPETVDISPPSIPGSLTATAVSSGVLLDWYDASDDSDITAYLVRRDGLAVAIVPSGRLSYIDTNVQPPTTAIYTVEALDVMGQHSQPSNNVTIEIPAAPYPQP